MSRPAAAACGLACALLAARCTASSTNVTAPSGEKCETAASAAPSSFQAAGGSGAVTISTERDCTWSISADSPWVSMPADRSGQGNAVVPYTVAPNPVHASRSGAIVVGSVRLAVSQAAAPCRFELDRTAQTFSAQGGAVSINVETLAGCGWTTASGVPWITVASGGSGSASGTVALTIAPNTGAARTGHVTVAGQDFAASQSAAASEPPAPAPAPGPSPGPGPEPTPPPQPQQPIDLDGRVFLLTGSCPTVSFWVEGRHVTASANTTYRKGQCGHLSNGDRVEVDGLLQPDGSVAATRITIKDDDH